MSNPDHDPSRTPARKRTIVLAIVVAGLALVIELLVALGYLSDAWASIGGGFVILALAISVIGRSIGRAGKNEQRG